MLVNTLFITGAYLLGSLPHLVLLSRLSGLEPRGDLHLRLWAGGKRLVSIIGVIGDIAKGVLVIMAGRWLELDTPIVAAGGVLAIAGQMWPVFAGFNGEKGNSISVGVIATLTPFTFLFAIIPMLGGLLVKVTFHLAGSRQLLREKLKFSGPPSLSLPLGMIAGFLVLPFASHWLGDPEPVTISYIASLVLIIIRRATAGLKQDLVKGTDIGVILKNRILYDRPVI